MVSSERYELFPRCCNARHLEPLHRGRQDLALHAGEEAVPRYDHRPLLDICPPAGAGPHQDEGLGGRGPAPVAHLVKNAVSAVDPVVNIVLVRSNMIL